MSEIQDPRESARRLAAAALDRKAEKVVALDVREITTFADAFVLATGTSDRHVRAVADAVLEAARELGCDKRGVEGYEEGRWVLLDLNDIVVHVFRHEDREHYDLDRLWGDATRIDLAEEGARGAAS